MRKKQALITIAQVWLLVGFVTLALVYDWSGKGIGV